MVDTIVISSEQFFLSQIMVKHTRVVYNILDLLSKFGGLAGIIFKVFAVLGRNFNERLLFSKFIRSLYFRRNYDPHSKKEGDE